jgi:NADH-quinone oxidoreductase subunit F
VSQKIYPAHPLEKRILIEGLGENNSWTLEHYEKNYKGYTGAKKALGMAPDDIIKVVKDSGLRGLGGAGFPTGMKWSFIPKNPTKPVYLVCNADEGEPGTYKDRQIMEHCPHRLIDGMIATAVAIGSKTGYIYIRGELRLAFERLALAIREAYSKGYLGENIFGSGKTFHLTVHPGAGAYICGEETGLIESLEGDRGQPRLKPPFPAISGVFGGPTIVNNVATLAHVPGILLNGAEWFLKNGNGTPRGAGTALWGVSGDVAKPCYFEVPVGTNLKVILNDICGGPRPGRKFKACYPGGSSSPLLTADEFDVPMDFDSLAAKGTMMGSCAIIVIDDSRSIPEICMRTARFYSHESCGQCVPCREGTKWTYKMLKRVITREGTKKDLENIMSACDNMMGKTICVLSDACAMPVMSMIKKFRSEFEELLIADTEAKAEMPKISGQLGMLVQSIRERQKS